MDNFEDKLVLVTGAGSGIGRETAFSFASEGARLVLADVDEKGCERTATLCRDLGARAQAQRVDVASEHDMRAFAERVHAEHGPLDVLVNNAGVAVAGSFMDTDLATWDWIIGVNLKGVVHGCHLFGKPMVERGQGGHIVNVSSAAGYAAAHMMSAYCTTKFAVVGLSECLRADLAQHDIGVSVICPGVINTGITQSARLLGDNDHPQVRKKIIDTYRRRNYGPERVASAILDAVRHNRALVPVTPEAWASYYLKRLLPGAAAQLARRVSLPR